MIVWAKLVTVYTNDKKLFTSSFLYIFFLYRPLFKCEIKSLWQTERIRIIDMTLQLAILWLLYKTWLVLPFCTEFRRRNKF